MNTLDFKYFKILYRLDLLLINYSKFQYKVNILTTYKYNQTCSLLYKQRFETICLTFVLITV